MLIDQLKELKKDQIKLMLSDRDDKIWVRKWIERIKVTKNLIKNEEKKKE